jgi:hypothetical protein
LLAAIAGLHWERLDGFNHSCLGRLYSDLEQWPSHSDTQQSNTEAAVACGHGSTRPVQKHGGSRSSEKAQVQQKEFLVRKSVRTHFPVKIESGQVREKGSKTERGRERDKDSATSRIHHGTLVTRQRSGWTATIVRGSAPRWTVRGHPWTAPSSASRSPFDAAVSECERDDESVQTNGRYHEMKGKENACVKGDDKEHQEEITTRISKNALVNSQRSVACRQMLRTQPGL